MVAPGGHAWLLQGGGMCGCSRGACVVALGGVHGCSQGACMVAPGGCAWLIWGGACLVAPRGACVVAPGGIHAWDTTRYGDTIKERAVRILLECILVF